MQLKGNLLAAGGLWKSLCLLHYYLLTVRGERREQKEGDKPPVTDQPEEALTDGSGEGKPQSQKELVEELKVEWKLLWSERFNDKVRGEDVSVSDYASLRVEQGTIIHATRDFKTLTFKEILEQRMIENSDRFVQPDVAVGGWRKFAKTKIISPKPQNKECSPQDIPKKQVAKHPKKGGRGWLHTT